MGSEMCIRDRSTVVAGWVAGIPLIDTVSVMVKRIAKGHSPMKAGRDHIHHILLDKGFSPSKTLITLALAQTLFVSIGLSFNKVDAAQPYLFWVFVALCIFHFICTGGISNVFSSRKRASRDVVLDADKT